MKNKLTIGGIVLILAVIFLWSFHATKRLPLITASSTNTLANSNSPVDSNSPSQIVKTDSPQPEISATPRLTPEESLKQLENKIDAGKNEWRTPIEFYGRVVDESNAAVSGVSVDFSVNDLSEKGTSNYHTSSDSNGFFSLKDVKGKLLVAQISKNGYYTSKNDNNSFEYADNHVTAYGKNNPIVFHLRKKGEGADLIHYDKSFVLPKDGTPVLIDLPTKSVNTSSQNAIQVEAWIYDSEKIDKWKFNWKCRVSVPGGGLQAYDEEFPFLAPEENYLPEEIIDMPVTNNPSWSNQARRNYYVRTADGKFGRMVFTMIPSGDHFCELNLYFNPTGSRNLEPK